MENVENTEWSDRELIPNRDVEPTTTQGSGQENQIPDDGRTPTWGTPTATRQPTRRITRRSNPRGLSGRNGGYDVGNTTHSGTPQLGSTIITPDDIAGAATITPEAVGANGNPSINVRNPEMSEADVDIILDEYEGSLFEDSWYTPPDVNTGSYVMGEERPNDGPNEGAPQQHYLDQRRGDDVLWHNVERCLQLRSPGWKKFQRDELQGDVNQLVHLVLQPNEIAARRSSHIRRNTSRSGTQERATTSFTSQEMYTLYQLGEYLGLLPEHEARDQLAALTPQRWIQWARFDAGSRIGPQQRNRSRDREHRRQGDEQREWQHGNTYPTGDAVPVARVNNNATVGWHGDERRQPNWERPRLHETRQHNPNNGATYMPPHKRGNQGLGGNAYARYNRRSSQGQRIQTIDHRNRVHQADTNPYGNEAPEEISTSTRGHQTPRQRQPGPHSRRTPNATPSHGNETSVSSDSTQGQRQGPTFQQVRSAIRRVEQYLAIPEHSGRESPQLAFFITQVVKDLYQQEPRPHSGDNSSIESDPERPPRGSTPTVPPYLTGRGQQSTLTSTFGRRPTGPTPPRTATSAWDQTHRAYFYSQGTTRQTRLTPDKFSPTFDGTAENFEQFMRGTRLCLGAYNLSYLLHPKLVRAWMRHEDKEHHEIAAAVPEPLRYRDQFTLDNVSLFHILGSKLNLPETAHLTEEQTMTENPSQADGIALWAALLDMYWNNKDVYVRLSQCFYTLSKPMGNRETMDQYVSRMYQAYLRLISIKESFEGSNEDYFKLWLLIQMKNQPYTELRDRLIEEPQTLLDTMKSLRAVARRRTFDAQGARRPPPHTPPRRLNQISGIPQQHPREPNDADGIAGSIPNGNVYAHLSRIPDSAWQQLPTNVRDKIMQLRAETRGSAARRPGRHPSNTTANATSTKPGDDDKKQYGGNVRANLLSSQPDHQAYDDEHHMDPHSEPADPSHDVHVRDFGDY